MTHVEHSDLDIVTVYEIRFGFILRPDTLDVIWEEASKQAVESELREATQRLESRQRLVSEQQEVVDEIKLKLTQLEQGS